MAKSMRKSDVPVVSPVPVLKEISNVRQDSRTMDDPLSGLEQVVLPGGPLTTGRSDPDLAAYPGTDHYVFPYVDVLRAEQSGRIQCAVAGRVHCYGYSWANLSELLDAPRGHQLTYVCELRYRNGYCRREREPDNLQPGAVFGQSTALEVSATRELGPESTLQHVQLRKSRSRSGHTTKYSGRGPGSAFTLLCVVGKCTGELGMHSFAIPTTSVHRCDLIWRNGRVERDYHSFTWQEGAKQFEQTQGRFLPGFDDDDIDMDEDDLPPNDIPYDGDLK